MERNNGTQTTENETMKIEKSYLQWAGASDYPTKEDFIAEVKSQGLSKRLPNHHVAAALMEPGTVVFMAHDDGEKKACGDCAEVVSCEVCNGSGEIAGTDVDNSVECEACNGMGENIRGTGGSVKLEDGTEIAYRDWLGMRRHAKHNERDGKPTGNVEDDAKKICATCGGSGNLPLGMIFGMYIPSAAQYIVPEGMEEEARKKIADKGVEMIPVGTAALEPVRKCGHRKAGGSYIVTKPATEPSEKAVATVEELIAQGLIEPEAVEITGDFVEFVKPVEIHGMKRFRGIRRYMLEAKVEAEAELIAEAM